MGCGTSGIELPDADVVPSDAAMPPPVRTIRFVLLSPEVAVPVQVTPGQRVAFSVELRDGDGRAVAEDVQLALTGTASDGSLSASRVHTDARGLSPAVTFVAPSTSATLRIRARAVIGGDLAPAAFLDVAVSARGFGGINVVTRYVGVRAPTGASVRLYEGSTCRTASPGDPVRTAQLSSPGGSVTFAGLAAGSTFSVRGDLTGRGGVALATGCIDGVVVTADFVMDLSFPLNDLPLHVEGAYVLTASIDLSPWPGRATPQWVAAVETVSAARGGDAAYLLAAVADAVEMRGGSSARATFERAVADRLLDELVMDLMRRAVSPVPLLQRMTADIAAVLLGLDARATMLALPDGLNNATIRLLDLTLILDPLTPEIARDDISMRPEGSPCALNPRCGEAMVLDGDRVRARLSGLNMSLEPIARTAVAAMLARAGATSAGEYLRSSVRCGILDAIVRLAAGSCDTSCVVAACEAALDRLGAAFDSAVTTTAGGRATSDIQFESSARAAPGTLTVTALDPAPLFGVYREDPAFLFNGVARLDTN